MSERTRALKTASISIDFAHLLSTCFLPKSCDVVMMLW